MRNRTKELTDEAIALDRYRLLQQINISYIIFYWETGKYYIDQKKHEDADYLNSESKRLTEKWGNIFSIENIRAAISFSDLIQDSIHVSVVGTLTTWKYLKVLLPLKDADLILSFIKLCSDENLSIEVLQESVNQIIADGNVPEIPKVKPKETKIDYLYSTKIIEHEKKGERVSVRSIENTILENMRQLEPDGLINNMFPDPDLEGFLKMNLSGQRVFQ